MNNLLMKGLRDVKGCSMRKCRTVFVMLVVSLLGRTVQKTSLRNSLLYIDLMLCRPKGIGSRMSIYTLRHIERAAKAEAWYRELLESEDAKVESLT